MNRWKLNITRQDGKRTQQFFTTREAAEVRMSDLRTTWEFSGYVNLKQRGKRKWKIIKAFSA